MHSGIVKSWSYGDAWARADSFTACNTACAGQEGCTHFGFSSVASICLMHDGEFRALDGDFLAIKYGEV